MYSQQFQETLWSLIEQRAKSDQLFKAELDKPNKSFENCLKYLTIEVKKLATQNSACLTDAEVMNIVVHYYDEDNIDKELEKKTAPSVKASCAAKPKAPTSTQKKIEYKEPTLFDNIEDFVTEKAKTNVVDNKDIFSGFDFNSVL